jgi:hypothetical protein
MYTYNICLYIGNLFIDIKILESLNIILQNEYFIIINFYIIVMNDNVENFIKKSLDYYDNQIKENSLYLENTEFEFEPTNYQNKANINSYKIIKNNDIIKEGRYELLGIFDFQTKIWISGWSIMMDKGFYTYNSLSRELFDYVYNLQLYVNEYDRDLYNYIHNQLTNSRILIEDSIELEIYLSTISYLLKNKINFIYNDIKYLNNDKTKYIIKYYFIL